MLQGWAGGEAWGPGLAAFPFALRSGVGSTDCWAHTLGGSDSSNLGDNLIIFLSVKFPDEDPPWLPL